MWNATVAAGGLELLDVPTFYRLAEFYNELEGGFSILGHLTALSDSYLVPLADEPATVFYEPGTTRLRRRYGWYIQDVRRVNQLAERLAARGDSLADLLDSAGARGSPLARRAEP